MVRAELKRGEAFVYWCAAEKARRMRRTSLVDDTSEQVDDVEVLLMHSRWQLLRQRAAAFLAETGEPVLENTGG